MAGRRNTEKSSDYNNYVINLTSSNNDLPESSQSAKRRRVNPQLTQFLDHINENNPEVTQSVDPTAQTFSVSQPVSALVDQARSNQVQATGSHETNFYSWLITTVILDDLSFREPFINSAWDANQLTEHDLLLRGVELYRNASQLRPQELVNLPFIPRPMRTGETVMDIPFLDPLLVVLENIHIDDIHWMLNVLPWRVIDRPIRSSRSILAWILEVKSIHKFLETTRAPLTVTVKIIRFLDSFCE